MKTKAFLLSLFVLISMSSCYTSSYLPQYKDIGTSPFGSEIELLYRSDEYIIGELIAVNDLDIIVLNKANNACISIPKKQITDYGIRFAQPKHYGIFIPTLSLASLAHGLVSIITLPINLVTTIVVTATAERAYTIDHKKLTYEQLKMYARFPQGIPEGLGLDLIKK